MHPFKTAGIEYRVNYPISRTVDADLAIIANNLPVALVALTDNQPPSWRRYNAYMHRGLPVFVLARVELSDFAGAWTTRSLRLLDRWRVPTKGLNTPPL